MLTTFHPAEIDHRWSFLSQPVTRLHPCNRARRRFQAQAASSRTETSSWMAVGSEATLPGAVREKPSSSQRPIISGKLWNKVRGRGGGGVPGSWYIHTFAPENCDFAAFFWNFQKNAVFWGNPEKIWTKLSEIQQKFNKNQANFAKFCLKNQQNFQHF